MADGEVVALRQRLKDVEASAADDRNRRERLDEKSRQNTRELGNALARMRRDEGWLESERRETMERRALASDKRLAEIQESWTWRIGSAVLWLPRKVKALVGGPSSD